VQRLARGNLSAIASAFFVENITGESGGYKRHIKSIIGELVITSNQANKLEVKNHLDRRTKISGAQWKAENVPQVLAHRCAYLNRLICDR
jgi:hypothetical protein